MEVAHAVLAASGNGQDRIAVVRTTGGLLLAVADGAGGTSAGAEAAEQAMQMVSEGRPPWAAVLEDVDKRLGGGECALVIACVSGTRISGASVGDCGAWLIADRIVDLTERQTRKPLLGSRHANATAFAAELGQGTLLLASDGLFNYTRWARVAELARAADLPAAVQALVNLPRLGSGRLADDVAVVLCRSS
jgi:serine/threonine protein phosphatase PrpC